MTSWLPATDMPRYVRELCEFVGFGEADAAAVRASAPLVLEHESALTTALYDHFLKFPESATFFLGPDGTPDTARIERRKHSLGRWLRETAQAAVTHESSYYLLNVGLAHSHRPTGPGGVIPAHLMVNAIALAQSALASVFAAALPAPRALEASVAWNKLLLVHLNVFLLGYLPPAPRP
ncbi:MAG TPA: protoglobin domain-containing protein [Methylomirabilota bacterium]|nr:protoglobin domain-containing protein [Methylomirabilota bacterium]